MRWIKCDLIAVKTEIEQKEQQEYQEDNAEVGRDNGQSLLCMEFKG